MMTDQEKNLRSLALDDAGLWNDIPKGRLEAIRWAVAEIAALRQRAEAAEAGAAACRHALERFAAQEDALNWGCGLEEPSAAYVMGKAALRSDAGRELLEQLRKAEGKAVSLDSLVGAVLALEPHADAPEPTVEALLDKVKECREMGERLRQAEAERDQLRQALKTDGDILARANRIYAAIVDVHQQHADDLCWMPADVNRIFLAADLPPQCLKVGDKAAMLQNCERYVACLESGGPWVSYAELEKERDRLAARVGVLESQLQVERGGKPCPLEVET